VKHAGDDKVGHGAGLEGASGGHVVSATSSVEGIRDAPLRRSHHG
jgi:hypothetical protein